MARTAAGSAAVHRAPAPGRLGTRLVLATLGPIVLVLGGFGFLAHDVAQRALEDELGRRLGTAAAAAALLILPEQIAAVGEGDEELLTSKNLASALQRAKDRLGVRRAVAVARDLTGRGDTDRRIALGARAHEFGADMVEIEQAARGAPAASPLFWGNDGLPYKRAYAAIGNPAAGFAVVEGSADYFVALAGFRRWLLTAGLAGLGIVVLATVLLARRITGPVSRLAAAAERIGRGDLQTHVVVETHDEIGLLAARLDEMREALRVRDERLQMMLAGIAHEVRNPLGGLELYAGLLREGLAGQPLRLEEVGRLLRELGYLAHVVTEFLEYARRPPLEFGSVDVRALLAEVAEVCCPGAKPAMRVLVDAADLQVRADRGQLRRAIINLTQNAVTAAGPSGTVILEGRPDGAKVVIEVRDSGAGVPAELVDQIFTPFFTTREKGTGLGLAFVRDIVRDHGGEVGVERAPEGGARFWVALNVG